MEKGGREGGGREEEGKGTLSPAQRCLPQVGTALGLSLGQSGHPGNEWRWWSLKHGPPWVGVSTNVQPRFHHAAPISMVKLTPEKLRGCFLIRILPVGSVGVSGAAGQGEPTPQDEWSGRRSSPGVHAGFLAVNCP